MASSGGDGRPSRKRYKFLDPFPTPDEWAQEVIHDSAPKYVIISAADPNIKIGETNIFLAYKQVQQISSKILRFTFTKEGTI